MKFGTNDNERNRNIEKFTGVDVYQVNDEHDYTLCEYYIENGSLAHQEGELLQRFGIELPDRLSDLRESIFVWPIEKEFFMSARIHINGVVTGCMQGRSIFSDFEMMLSASKEDCWVRLSAMSFANSGQSVIGLLFVDITEEKKNMLRLMDRAATDPLTNALNRTELVSAVSRLAEENTEFAVIMLDVDGFKIFNDTCGHITGDNMLVDIVEKLRHGLRREDIIGRIGGDEFMICLRDVSDTAIIERLAKHICVLAHHSMPNGLSVSASLGIALCPRDGVHFEELYRKADIAMYEAKRSGGDTFVIYKPENDRPTEPKNNGEPDENALDCGVLIDFRILETKFIYPEIMTELFGDVFDSRPLWRIFEEDGIASVEASDRLRQTIEELSFSNTSSVTFSEYFLHTVDGIWRWYRFGFVRSASESRIWLILRDINEEIISNRRLRHISEYDELTGLLTHSAFNKAVENIMSSENDEDTTGYSMVFFDIIRFKAINDMFGITEGDRLLTYIADVIVSQLDTGAAGRIGSDRFAVFIRKQGRELEQFIKNYLDALSTYELAFEIVSNVGIYSVNDTSLSADSMLDRAIIAQSSIKGSYTLRYNFYNENMRKDMLGEQEIVGAMTTALAEDQFKVFYQPQYNHANGMLIGAEALVRWQHPDRGIIYPNSFIPIFEKNGFITKLDYFVYNRVCSFLSDCISKGIKTVPVSVNLTRFDIFEPDFIDKLESTRRKYDVPVELIRLEITETTLVGGNKLTADVIERLHELGYVVEMDDFGSGYSSLNVLKDVNMDVIKLDMQFITENIGGSNRAGTILSSIVRMAKWLNLTVIAEGVENERQAEYLRSIGCSYIQGYLYTRPITEEEYLAKLMEAETDRMVPQMQLEENIDGNSLWDPESQDTLIFNNYVGAAAIFDYHDGAAEVLRINKKYIREMDINPETGIIGLDLLSRMISDEDRWNYTGMIQRAIESGGEEECEVWYNGSCCGKTVCVRSCIRVIGRSDNSYLIYENVRNITNERQLFEEIRHREEVFKQASEHSNIYCWEYDVADRIMRPCFRCMRDLKLPPIVENYPEPAIDVGIFPPDYADIYREFMQGINDGTGKTEIDIPLTTQRIPFRIKYTVECDADGKPVKAYGSAAPIEEKS